MTTRWKVERAVLRSRLEPPARLIILALLAKADNKTAIIPSEHSPSLSTLQEMTGLSRSAVTDWLNALEDAKWVLRERPACSSGGHRTCYALMVGAETAPRLPRRRRSATSGSSGFGSPPGGLASTGTPTGETSDSSTSGSPPSGLVRHTDHTTDDTPSPPHGLGVVRQADQPHAEQDTLPGLGSPPGGPASTKYLNPTKNPSSSATPKNDEQPPGQDAEHRQEPPPDDQTDNPPSDPPEDSSTKNKKRKPRTTNNRGTRINPDTFTVTHKMIAWAEEKTPNVDLNLETEKFLNYWTAEGGVRAQKIDWVAAWRTWMINAEQRAPRNRYPLNGTYTPATRHPNQQRRSGVDDALDGWEALARRAEAGLL